MSAQARVETLGQRDPRFTNDPVGEDFEEFAAALAELAREKTAAFVAMQTPDAVIKENQEVLAVVAGDEMLSAMRTALNLAPQGPLTPALFDLMRKNQRGFAATINDLFPADPEREEVLAQLVRTFRTSLTHFSQG